MRRWTPGATMSPSSDKRWPYTRRSSATREYTTPTPKGPWRGSPTKEIQLSPSLRGCPSLAWWPWDFPSTSSEDKKQKKKTGQLSPYRPNRASPRSGSSYGLWVDKACYLKSGSQMLFGLEQL